MKNTIESTKKVLTDERVIAAIGVLILAIIESRASND
jgi:hypothetical protein